MGVGYSLKQAQGRLLDLFLLRRSINCRVMILRIDLIGAKLMVVAAIDANSGCAVGKQVLALQDSVVVHPGILAAVDQDRR